MLNLPNILTLLRIALLVPIIALFYMESAMGANAAWICLGLYIIASLTDFFDGYLARKNNQITAFGTFLDPISDKVFVGTLLILLVGFGRLPDFWMITVIIILAREFLVSGMREFLGPHNIKMPVTNLAKWKTTVQMIAVGLLIIGPYLGYTLLIGQLALVVAAILTCVTGWIYLKVGLKALKDL